MSRVNDGLVYSTDNVQLRIMCTCMFPLRYDNDILSAEQRQYYISALILSMAYMFFFVFLSNIVIFHVTVLFVLGNFSPQQFCSI